MIFVHRSFPIHLLDGNETSDLGNSKILMLSLKKIKLKDFSSELGVHNHLPLYEEEVWKTDGCINHILYI